MAVMNFTTALMNAKRRARLSGRPLSRQEASGIAEGFADSASSRLARAKTLGLQEQQLATQERQFDQSMTFNREITGEQHRIADEATSDQRQQDAIRNYGTAAAFVADKSGLLDAAGTAASTFLSGLFEPAAGLTAGQVAVQTGAPAATGLAAAEAGAATGAGGTAAAGAGALTPAAAVAGVGAALTIGYLALQNETNDRSGANPVQAYQDFVRSGRVQNQEGRIIPEGYNPVVGYKEWLASITGIPDLGAKEHEDQIIGSYQQAPQEVRDIIDQIVANPDSIDNFDSPFNDDEWAIINRFKRQNTPDGPI